MMLMMMIMVIKLKDETDATVAGDDNVVYVYDISRVMIKNQMVDFATKQWQSELNPLSCENLEVEELILADELMRALAVLM